MGYRGGVFFGGGDGSREMEQFKIILVHFTRGKICIKFWNEFCNKISKFMHNLPAPNAFSDILKMMNLTNLYDTKLDWQSPIATCQMCFNSLEYRIHSFKPAWHCPMFKILVTWAKSFDNLVIILLFFHNFFFSLLQQVYDFVRTCKA